MSNFVPGRFTSHEITLGIRRIRVSFGPRISLDVWTILKYFAPAQNRKPDLPERSHNLCAMVKYNLRYFCKLVKSSY